LRSDRQARRAGYGERFDEYAGHENRDHRCAANRSGGHTCAAADAACRRSDEDGKGGGGVPSTSPAALNSLAKNHGKDTLKQIEAKCDPALDPTCK